MMEASALVICKQKLGIIVLSELEVFKRKRLLLVQDSKSIHGSYPHLWHTSGKFGLSLRRSWISVSKTWMKFGSLATFKLGNGCNIFFWLDLWCSDHLFKESFSLLYRMAALPKGSINEHWDPNIRSWNLLFRRPLKEDELAEFQLLLGCLEGKKPSQTSDLGLWSLDSSGKFTVKSLSKNLNFSLLLDKELFQAVSKTSQRD